MAARQHNVAVAMRNENLKQVWPVTKTQLLATSHFHLTILQQQQLR